jgi:predicted RNase H-like nuclease (RuvC/YqgF family)
MNREEYLMKTFPLSDGTTYTQNIDKHMGVYEDGNNRVYQLQILNIQGENQRLKMEVQQLHAEAVELRYEISQLKEDAEKWRDHICKLSEYRPYSPDTDEFLL